MKAVAILLAVLMLTLLGLFTSAASNRSLKAPNLREGTPLFLPHLLRGAALTSTPTPTYDPADLPDLEPYSHDFVYDDPCPWGSPGKAWARVKNSGGGDAGSFTVYFLAGDSTVVPVPGLAAGATAEVALSFREGPVPYVYIVADYGEEVMESDETNNSYSLAYTPPPPCTPTGTPAP